MLVHLSFHFAWMNITKYGGVQSVYNTKTNNILNILLHETFSFGRKGSAAKSRKQHKIRQN